EGHVVQLGQVQPKPFIHQVKELPHCRFPLSYDQSFGLPVTECIRYPFDCMYETSFVIEGHLQGINLMFEEQAIVGEYHIELNGITVGRERLVPAVTNVGHYLQCNIDYVLKQGLNTLAVRVVVDG